MLMLYARSAAARYGFMYISKDVRVQKMPRGALYHEKRRAARHGAHADVARVKIIERRGAQGH